MCAAVLVACLTRVSAAAETTYAGHVTAALADLTAGKTREACGHLRQAFVANANDPLAHTTLGFALLMGGHPDGADSEFRAAIEMDDAFAEAIYGRALVCLSKGRIADATTLFCQAQSADPAVEAQSAIRYTKYLAGAADGGAGAEDDEAALALSAAVLAKRGRTDDACSIWADLQRRSVRPGFGERIGCSMTFVAANPVSVAGWPLKAEDVPNPSEAGRLPAVSKRIALRADLSRTRTVSLVSFFVDGRLVGVTNREPFEYSWDTTTVANGIHTLRILGTDSTGANVSEKTTRVRVQNAGAKQMCDRVTGPEADEARLKLRSLIRLKPSAAAVNYSLALCALAENDREAAVAALERTMAADPGYRDAANRLAGMLGAPAHSGGLHGVSGVGKAVALTFDDGPKAETKVLLEALRKKGVKATFFVVGKQVEANPDILRQMDAEGHEIQNHTYGHRALEFLSSREIQQELFACAAAVRAVIGKPVTMLRPPGARHGKALDEVARRFGYTTVFWTANCSGIEGTGKDKMLRYVVSSAKPGAIILMHNVDRVTLAALPGIIDALRSKGYTFLTLSEMMRQRQSAARAGGLQGGKNGLSREDNPRVRSKS